MRARSWGGLVAVVVLAMLLPATVAAQSELEADNPSADCRVPLTETIVSGDLGSTVVVDGTAEIDLVTLDTEYGGEVVDVDWEDDGHAATIVASDQVSEYIVWSCAPMNGEPVQQNDGQDV